MSRICVKNLPKHVAEDELREFFSEKGIITDVKLMRTKDGKSRQFAFIGYRTENEAHEAIRYFNNSFLRTSKITCEVARKLGDENLPRPWSRHSKKKNDKESVPDVGKPARAKGRKESLKNGVDVDDPQLQDFLQVMQPRVNSKMWANDTSGLTSVDNNRGVSNKDKNQRPCLVLMMEMSMLAPSFPGFAKPSATVKPSLLTLRASSLRHDYPLASKIVVKNLPYSTGETTLQKEFSNFGKIAEVKMVKDMKTKRSKGIAFIQYTCQDDAMLALETMDQKDFYGRTIYVEIARLGWDYFGATPRASGPPKKWDLPEQEEVVDCWY